MNTNFGKFMKKVYSAIFLVTFLLLPINSTFSQGSTYQFLQLDMSARAAALGGTFVSNGDNPDVIFYNPAGLEFLDKSPVSFSFVKHVLDINFAKSCLLNEFQMHSAG